jgi:hypothetical protein
MKTTAKSAAASALAATIMVFAINALSAGPLENSDRRLGNSGVGQTSGKSDARKSGKWFADPERGWVRVDERRDGAERTRPSNTGKAKSQKTK